MTLALLPAAGNAWPTRLSSGRSGIDPDLYDLHLLVLCLFALIALIVFGAMLHAGTKFQGSEQRTPAQFTLSKKAEAFWTLIPAVILFLTAGPATQMLVNSGDAAESGLTIQMTASQQDPRRDPRDSTQDPLGDREQHRRAVPFAGATTELSSASDRRLQFNLHREQN